MAKRIPVLDLGRLAAGSPPGVTPAMGQFVAEAASVLLEHNRHKRGVLMEVEASSRHRYRVNWPTLHENAVRTHNDLSAAAEQGAYGVAFLLAEELTDFSVIERSRKGTGFDYWLGAGGDHPFQQAARLEVSGIVNDADQLNPRVKAKMRQTDRSADSLPAFVAVVEFGQPKSVFKRRR